MSITASAAGNFLIRFCTLLLTLAPLGATSAAPSCAKKHAFTDAQLLTMGLSEGASNIAQLADGLHTVQDIRLVRQAIFPQPDRWLYRQANRYHHQTRESVLRATIPFAAGDAVRATQIAEAERALRGTAFLGDALILIREVCDDRITLDVIVRDVWTIWPVLDFSRSGGESETTIGVSDANWRGTGKSVELSLARDADGTGVQFLLADPRLANGRWRRKLELARSDDGSHYEFSIVRPFYAFNSASSAGLSLRTSEFERDNHYFSEDILRFDKRIDHFNAFVARSLNQSTTATHRLYAGATYLKERINVVDPSVAQPPIPTREYAYPYLGWQYLEDEFTKTIDIHRVGTTVDVSLGWNSYLELGWSPKTASGQSEYLLANGRLSKNWSVGDANFLSTQARFSGRYDLRDDVAEDTLVQVTTSYLHTQAPRWRGFVSANLTYSKDLSIDEQLMLGGDSGLRGYPSRYQPGDRSWLLTFEERYHARMFPLQLFRLGFVGFIDVGRAWFEDGVPSYLPNRRGRHLQTLANAGVGLRLESVRTRRDRVVHIDLAFALVDGPAVNEFELTFALRQQL